MKILFTRDYDHKTADGGIDRYSKAVSYDVSAEVAKGAAEEKCTVDPCALALLDEAPIGAPGTSYGKMTKAQLVDELKARDAESPAVLNLATQAELDKAKETIQGLNTAAEADAAAKQDLVAAWNEAALAEDDQAVPVEDIAGITAVITGT